MDLALVVHIVRGIVIAIKSDLVYYYSIIYNFLGEGGEARTLREKSQFPVLCMKLFFLFFFFHLSLSYSPFLLDFSLCVRLYDMHSSPVMSSNVHGHITRP